MSTDEEIEALIETALTPTAIFWGSGGDVKEVQPLIKELATALRSLSARNRAMREALERIKRESAGVPARGYLTPAQDALRTIYDASRTALSEQTTKPVETNNGTH